MFLLGGLLWTLPVHTISIIGLFSCDRALTITIAVAISIARLVSIHNHETIIVKVCLRACCAMQALLDVSLFLCQLLAFGT